MEEIVDILDDSFKVIGQKEKKIAHQKGLLHPCIIAELIDSQGNWTLVQQSADRQDPGKFVSPVGGHIASGESEIDALKRETLEEVGITVFTHTFIGKAVLNREVIGRKENHLFILYELRTDQKPTLNHESVSYKKFSPQELKFTLKKQPDLFGEAFHFVVDHFYPKFKQ